MIQFQRSPGYVELQEPMAALARAPSDFQHSLRFPPPHRLHVYDDTLRDGEQMPGVAFSPQMKYAIARALSDAGVHCMCVGFPAVSEGERETLKLVLQGRRRGELRPDVEIACMTRATRSDIAATVRAVEEAGEPPTAIRYLVFTSASDLHIKYKLGRSLLRRDGLPDGEWLARPLSHYRDANIRMFSAAIRYAASLGADDIEVGAEDASRCDIDYLVRLYRASIAAGAGRVILPDTVGCYSPYAAATQTAALRAGLGPDVPIVVHFHNDLGIAAWNTVVALGSGAESFMTSVNGLGERTGNAPLHQVLMQLRYLFDVEVPGFAYGEVRRLAHLVERLSGIPVPPTEPGIGRNVFRHESGIHTAGMMIHPSIYQFIPPGDWGAEIEYVYGKHSGAQVIEHAVRLAGVDCSPELVERVTAEVKRLREERAVYDPPGRFQEQYERHLDGLGISLDEVIQLTRILAGEAVRAGVA